MTLKLLKEICERNNIPEDARLLSDSGWECDETEMDGVWYEPMCNVVIFTQGGRYESPYRYTCERRNPEGYECICLYRADQ